MEARYKFKYSVLSKINIIMQLMQRKLKFKNYKILLMILNKRKKENNKFIIAQEDIFILAHQSGFNKLKALPKILIKY